MSDQRSVATGVRRRAMIVGCAIAAFCVVAMAGETARRGGSESSELLYIDAGGETQHVLVDGDVAEKYTGDRLSEMLASSPSLAEKKKARAKANLQKKKADLSAGSFPTHEYDDAPILDALADHEQREKKVELTLKAMHTKPAAPKVWQDKKVSDSPPFRNQPPRSILSQGPLPPHLPPALCPISHLLGFPMTPFLTPHTRLSPLR